MRFVVVHGAGHGGPAFTTPAQLASIDEFLRAQLLPRQASSAKR